MENTKLIKLAVKIIGALIVVILLNPVVKINAGERGIVLNWGAVSDEILEEGIHFRVPFQQKIVKLDVRTSKYEVEALAYSKDIQTVHSLVALNYHLSSDQVNKLWQEIGQDYESRIIDPSIQESVKAATANFTAQELIEKRPLVKEEIRKHLFDRLNGKYIIVDDFSIVNFDFSGEYEKAVEEKQVAQQSALKAENDLKRIEIEAKQKIETAKADAESIRIQGAALSQNPALVDLKAVEKWNGTLPQYMLGETVPFLNVNQTTNQ